jgi:hypothetical protein
VARVLVADYVSPARQTLDLRLRAWCNVWFPALLVGIASGPSFYCHKISVLPGFGQVAPGRDRDHIEIFYDILKKVQKVVAIVRPLWYVYPMKKTPKPQKQKANVIRVQELRRSNATTRHKSIADYRRKPKHPNKGWDE